jgi:gliding motility-associated-like protein
LVSAGSDQAVCENTATLDGTIPGVGESGIWSQSTPTAGITQSTLYNTTVTSLSNGVNTFTWTLSNGICTNNFDAVSVTNNSFTVSIPSTANVCGSVYTLPAANPSPGTGLWEITSGSGTIVSPTLYNSSLTDLPNGTTELRWTVSKNNCTAIGTINITNNTPDAIAEAEQFVCSTNSLIEASSPGLGTGRWEVESSSGVISESTDFNTLITGLDQGNNYFLWIVTSPTGCEDTAYVKVVNNEVISNAGSNQVICGTSSNFDATDVFAGSGQWTLKSGSADAIAQPTKFNAQVTGLGKGDNVFTWTITYNGCSDADDILIRNDLPTEPVITPGYDLQTVCVTSAELRANSPSYGTGEWFPLGGTAVMVDPTSSTTSVNTLAPGTNKIVWAITNNACVLRDTAFIENNSISSYAGPDKVICDDNYSMSATLTSGNGVWSLAYGAGTFVNSTDRNTAVTNIGIGENSYVWTITGATCSASDNVLITNNKPSEPNAGVDETICDNFYTLGANTPTTGTGFWTREVGSADIAQPSDFNTSVSDLSWGTNRFKWTITNVTCSLSDEVDIINNAVYPNAEADKVVCTSTSTIAADVPVHGTGQWIATGLASIENATLATTNVSDLSAGSNKFIWRVTYGSCIEDADVEITNSSVAADAGDYQEVCSTTATLAANNPTSGTGTWTISGVSSALINMSNQYNTVVSNLVAGVSTTFKWTIDNGYCQDEDEVTIKNADFVVFAGGDQRVCSTSALLNGELPGNGGTGVWTKVGAAGNITNATLYNTSVNGLLDGPNSYRWTITRGNCSNHDQVDIYNDKPTTAYAGADQEVCNNLATITANNPLIGTGNWSVIYGGGSINQLTDFSTTVSGLSQGQNLFVWTVMHNACTSIDTVLVMNNFVTANAVNNFEVCASSAIISADEPGFGTGEWSIVNFGTIANNTNYITSVSNLVSGINTFKWTVTEGSCSVSDEITLTNNMITANAGVNQNICITEGVLQGNLPASSTGYWTVTTGSAVISSISTIYNASFAGLTAGTSSTFSWTLTKGSCTDVDDVAVRNYDFEINAGDDQNVCTSHSSLLAEDPGTGVGYWTALGSSAIFANSALSSTAVTNLDNGSNLLLWTVTKNNCTASDTVKITNNSPSLANAGNDLEVCSSDANLLATKPLAGTGYWSTYAGNAIVNISTNYSTSVSNLDVGINTFKWTVTNGICDNIDFVSVINNSVVAEVQNDTAICQNFSTIYAEIPSLGTGVWAVQTGGGAIDNTTNFTANISNLALGLNTFTWTVSEGKCADVEALNVTNNQVTANAGTDQATCAATYQLQANNPVPGTGIWTTAGSAGINDPSKYNSFVSGLPAGSTSIFTWTITKGTCSDDDEVSVTNNQFTISAGPDQTICVDTTVMLADEAAPGTGTWSLVGINGTFVSLTNHNTIVRNLGQGDNIYRWSVSRNNCSSSDDVLIRNNRPTTANAGADQTTCASSAMLQATNVNIGTGEWYKVGGDAVIGDATQQITNVSGLLIGVNKFRWTVTNQSCVSSDTVTITNKGLVSPYAGQDQVLCNNSVTLSVADPSPAAGIWTVTEGTASIDNNTSININVTALGSGKNVLRWTISQNACSAFDDVALTVNQPSIANAGVDKTICEASYNLVAKEPDPGRGTGNWSIINGVGSISIPSDYSTMVTFLGNGANTFRWIVTYGECTTYDDVVITNRTVVANAGSNQDVCNNYTSLNASVPADGSGTWSRLGSGIIVNETLRNTLVTDLAQGSNTFRWTVDNGICDDIDDVIIENNAFVVNAGLDQNACINSTTLDGSQHPLGTGTWTRISGTSAVSNVALYNSGVTALSSGQNMFVWSVTQDACTFKDTVLVDYLEILANAGPSKTICTDSVQLNAIPATQGSGLWSIVNGNGSFKNDTLYNTWVTGLNKGANTFAWTITNKGCSNSALVVITNDSPSTASTGNDVVACVDFADITAIAPVVGTGKWSIAYGSGVIANTADNNTTVSSLDYGTNRFAWTVKHNSCSSTDEILVTNNKVTPNAGADKNLCANTVRLAASPSSSGVGYWSSLGGNAVIENTTLYNSMVYNLGAGSNQFKWTVSENNCTSADTVIISNYSIESDAGLSQLVCEPDANLSANDPGLAGLGTWKVVAGAGIFANSTLYNSSVSGLNKGSNRLRWTVVRTGAVACADSSDIIITNNQVDADAGMDDVTCSSTYQLFADNPSLGTGIWTVEEGAGTFTSQFLYNTFVNGMQQGQNKYKWTVTELSGCSASSIVTIDNISVNANAGYDTIICATDYRLAGNNPNTGSGYWSVVSGGGVFDNSAQYNTYVRSLTKGANTLRWTVSQGACSSYDDVMVTSNHVVVNAGSNQTICNDVTQLAASSPGTGTGIWSVDYGYATFDKDYLFNTAVTGIGLGDNTLRWTVTQGDCSSSDIVIIRNNYFDVSAGYDRDICVDTVQLFATEPAAGGLGRWTISGGTGATIDNSTYYNTVVRNISEGVNAFTWSVTQHGCTYSDQVVITNNSFSTYVAADQVVCDDNTNLVGENPNEGTSTGEGVWTSNTTAVIVNPTYYNTEVNSLVAGSNTFTWTLSRNNCSESASMVITYNKVVANVGSDASVCINSGMLIANNPQYGTGVWTVTEGAGIFANSLASSTAVSGLSSGTNIFRWTVTNATCQKFAEMKLVNNEFTINAGDDQNVCEPSAILAGGDPGVGTGTWTVVSGSGIFANANNPNTNVSGLASGENKFKWKVLANNCPTEDVVSVFNNKPSMPYAGVDQAVCNDMAVMAGNNPTIGTGFWSVSSGSGSFDNPSVNNTAINALGKGTNALRWTITNNNCAVYDEVIVTNNTVVSDAGLGQTVCVDEAYMTGNQPAIGAAGTWSVVSGIGSFDDIHEPETRAYSISSGTNIFRWTVKQASSGCTSFSDVNIINDRPTQAIVGGDKPVCTSTVSISGNIPLVGSGYWTVEGGTGNVVNPTANNTQVTRLGTGVATLRWTISKGECSLYDEFEIDNNAVYVTAGLDRTVCGSATALTGNSPTPGTGLWTIESGTGILANPTQNNSLITNLSTGSNVFKWTVAEGDCSSSDLVVITNNAFNASAGVDQPLCSNTTTIVANDPPVGVGRWTVEAGSGIIAESTQFVTEITGLAVGSNTLRWTVTKDGCSNYDEVEITNNSVYSTLGADRVICNDYSTLVANDPAVQNANGYWSVIGGAGSFTDASNYITDITDLGPGRNTFRWTVYSGLCSDFDDIVISNNKFTTSAGPDQDICSSEIELIASDPLDGAGEWEVIAGSGTFADKTSYQTLVSGLSNGINTFMWTANVGGCSDDDIVEITNNFYKAEAGVDQDLCVNSTVLSAIKPESGIGTWSLAAGSAFVQDVNLPNSKVTSLGVGVNKLRWTVEKDGCISFDLVEIVNNAVNYSAGLPQNVCNGEVTLAADEPNSGGTGLWSLVSGSGIISNRTIANPLVTELFTGANTFRWTVTENGCTGSSLVSITDNTFITDAGDDQIVVVNNTTMEAKNGVGQWEILSGQGVFVNPYQFNTDVINLGVGNNVFRWTVEQSACFASDDVLVVFKAFSADAGVDQALCEDTTSLNAVEPDFGEGQWEKVSGSGIILDVSNPKSRIINIGRGPNVFRWTVCKNGLCVSDEMTITNNSFDISAGENQESCYSTLNMNAENPGAGGVGSWLILAGGGNLTGNYYDAIVNGLQSGENIFEWTVVRNTCVDKDTVSLTYHQPPSAAFTVDDDANCSPLESNFSNNTVGAVSYLWTFGDGQFSPLQNPSHTFVNSTVKDTVYHISLKAVNDFGCADTARYSVNVYAIPVVDFLVTPSSQNWPVDRAYFFLDESSEGYVDYLWDFGDGENQSIMNPTVHVYADWGEYMIRLQISSLYCSAVDSQLFIINAAPPEPLPNAPNGRTYQGCAPLTVAFLAKTQYAESFYWDFGDGRISTAKDTTIVFEEAGRYFTRLVSTGDGGTAITQVDTIIVYPVPVADFTVTPDSVMANDELVTFRDYSVDAFDWKWLFGDGDTAMTRIANHLYKEPGIYDVTLIVSSEKACIDSMTIRQAVVVEPQGEIKFPDAFTPNPQAEGDGSYVLGSTARATLNDVFYPVIQQGILNYHLEIFNRWGERIFETDDINTGWNGYYRNRLSPQDVYVYRYKVTFKNGRTKEGAGNVTLVR